MHQGPIRLRRPSPALVVATVALVASLTGTAVAASLTNNEVRSQHIANGQVKRADIAVNAVDSPLVRDGSLIAADIQNGTLASNDVRDDSLRGADIADNSLTGDDVDESALKGFMPAAVRVVAVESAAVATDASVTTVATCAATERALGGGAAWVLANGELAAGAATISASMPEPANATADPTGWRAAGRNSSGGALVLRAYAFCSARP